MLAERLSKQWRARQVSAPIAPAMEFSAEGLVLGAGTVLAPADANGRTIRLEGCEVRLATLLSAAHLRPAVSEALSHIRKAVQRWGEGEEGLARVHLALSRVGKLDEPGPAAHRLFLADGLMQSGIEPEAIFRALNLDPSMLETLTKDYRDQPRVPEGSGRPSGQWTSDAGANDRGASEPSGGSENGSPGGGAEVGADLRAKLLPISYAAQDTASARRPPALSLLETPPKITTPIAGRPWFVGLTGAQLGELALFVARFGGPIAALGTVFIPFNKSLRQEGTVPGWPPIHYLWHSDQRALVFSYLGQDLRTVTKTAELGEDGLFRDVDRKVIGRALPDGGVVIDRSAILPAEPRGKDEPTLCPAPVPDKKHKNLNGLLFEDHIKALINPGNPTPSGFGVKLLNPATGNFVFFDDCQRRSGILFDYKSVTYAKLLNSSFSKSPMDKLIEQATNQVNAAEGDHIVWVFAEPAARDAVEKVFKEIDELRGHIQLISEPWPGTAI